MPPKFDEFGKCFFALGHALTPDPVGTKFGMDE